MTQTEAWELYCKGRIGLNELAALARDNVENERTGKMTLEQLKAYYAAQAERERQEVEEWKCAIEERNQEARAKHPEFLRKYYPQKYLEYLEEQKNKND